MVSVTSPSCLNNPQLPAAVGINGFGRIGRNVLRAALARSDIKIVAINHTCSTAEDLLYLLRNDSSMGVLDSRIDVQRLSESMICIDGQKISLISQRDVKKINWSALGAEYILECTGKFTKKDLAMDHIVHGHAKRVIISAPSPDSPTFVYGVNSESYLPSDDYRVVSNASCTTNCITPVLKVLHDNFGIAQAFLTTVHAATRSQQVLDGYNNKNRRLGRGVFNNIIPTTTGAAKAVAAVLPELQGRVTGISLRVPTSNVSLIDLTVSTVQPTRLSAILDTFRQAAKLDMAGIVTVADEELVSSDYLGSPYSAIIDAPSCVTLNSRFFKIMAWYDNEWGYSNRLLDMARLVHARDAA